ncbi:hypothetical protein FPZ52_09445 [Qingshengfaniella alkalisoli]|uniref:Arginine transporter n=1 Tax=Qingshengfaniella alkalisoli TaxID=2599296 RepID=A0A5B8IW02_9RHOB|nr:hypothetical protein FPZ52_09445 [Qingshengfaniella alkalisoli]
MVACAVGSAPQAALAGPVERACNQSDRRAATPQLCSCIGAVAQQTLSHSDQRTAARFFKDPQQAQTVRMSAKNADNAFWDRYRAFGDYARSYCG